MITFTYEDIETMQEAIKLGTLQSSVLEYFQELEDCYELPLNQYMNKDDCELFYHFDAQFDEFDLREDEIGDPSKIYNPSKYRHNGLKYKAAAILHEMIEVLYKHFLTLSPSQKDKLRIANITQEETI